MSATGALTLTTDAAPTELGHAVHELVTRQIDIDQFVDRFLVARVYALCPVRPGCSSCRAPARHRSCRSGRRSGRCVT